MNGNPNPGSGPITNGTEEVNKSSMGGWFDDLSLDEFSETIIIKISDFLTTFFAPVVVTYSNELLSNQFHNISLILFILTLILLLNFFVLLFNFTLFIFTEKLIGYFKNKYVLYYLNLNKKLIGLEIFFISC
jgi:hypothetical protein